MIFSNEEIHGIETCGGQRAVGGPLVGLCERELSTRSNSPAVPSNVPSWLGTEKLALAKTNIVCYGVVQKMFMPSPEFHARKMRNEKGGLGSNTHQCIVLPNFPLSFAFIILTVVPTLRFPCCVDIIVNQICFGALSSR